MIKWFRRKDGAPEKTEEPSERAPDEEVSIETVTVEAPPPEPPPVVTEQGLFQRLRQGLSKTSDVIGGRIRAAIGLKERVDEEVLEEIE